VCHDGRDGSVQPFARIVAPQRWDEVFLLMLTACFDTARTDIAHDLVVVAGFAGFAKAWSEFDFTWNDRLKRDGLSVFHSGDFAQFRKEFKYGWRDNEPRRIALLRDLMDIIRGHGLRRFGCAVPIGVQQGISPQVRSRFDAYVHAALATVDQFNHYARSINVDRNVRCVFEKGENETILRERFREEGYADPDFTWKSPFTDRKGFTHDGFLGLQAAGWIAYEYYLDTSRVFDVKTSVDAIENGRWAYREFETLPGFIQCAVSPKVSEMVVKVRDATQHLAKLRPHRKRGVV
jgi:hypothetical protein